MNICYKCKHCSILENGVTFCNFFKEEKYMCFCCFEVDKNEEKN